MDDDEDSEAKARRQARRQPGPSPAKRKGGPSVSPNPRLEPLGENETIQDRAPSPIARPQAPTPKKASGKPFDESPAPTRPSSKLAPPRAPPSGPRPPLSPRGSSYTSSDSGCVPITPAIVLQEATPTKEMLPPSTISSRPVSVVDPSPPSAAGPPLNVPQVHDIQLQHFFNEVANQLNTMNIRSSVASGSSGNSAILGSDYQAYLAYASSQAGPPVSPVIANSELDPNQFADADDDETIELASTHSSFAPSMMGGQHSPLIGLGLGGPPSSQGRRPGLQPIQTGGNAQRWSYASSHGSSHLSVSPASAVSESPGLYSPNPSWSAQPETQGLRAQRVAPAPPRTATRDLSSRPSSPLPNPMGQSLLQREGSYVVIDDSDVPASDPSFTSWGSKQSGFSAHRGQDGFGMLKKKKKGTLMSCLSLALSSENPQSRSTRYLILLIYLDRVPPLPPDPARLHPSEAGSTISSRSNRHPVPFCPMTISRTHERERRRFLKPSMSV